MSKFLLFVLLIIGECAYAQSTLTGIINNESTNPISFANILVKTDSTTIIGFGFSSEKGEYIIKTDTIGKFNLIFSALGYKTKIIPVELTTRQEEIKIDVVLKEKIFELDTVAIQADRPITIKNDTIVFDAKSFARGNEQVVEDLLKNIPGINIDSKGTIMVGDKEVEKVMIDGDDLFEKGYKILTKNMPSHPIDKIEVYKRYANNKLLKGIEESDKVALNLKLREDFKRIWFGNVSMGHDVTLKNRYILQGNLMNFGKKNKYYFLTNINNIGHDATGDIDHLIRPFRMNEPSSVGDDEQAYSLLDLSSYTPNFKESRTNFNNTKLISTNAIFALSKKIKLKTLGFFNWDENDYFRNSTQTFSSNDTDFTNTESSFLKKKRVVGFGKINLVYDISKTKMLEVTTKYNNQDGNSFGNLEFNTDQTTEGLVSKNHLFDQKVSYTNKFKANKVFILTGRYINENTPQNYSINQFFYQNLFADAPNTNNIVQLSENKMTFAGFEAHLLDRKRNGNLLELQFGNQFRKDGLFTSLLLKENSTALETPNEYQNNLLYTTHDLYFNTKYKIVLKGFALTGKLDFHQLYNQIEEEKKTKQRPFFITPKIGLEWKINKKNKVLASYTYNTTNAEVLDVYNKYILTSFTSFSKGTGGFNQLTASSAIFNYQLGNWGNQFFANVFVLYNRNHDFFSTKSFITQNYSQYDKIVIKDREMFTVSSNIDRYITAISSNLKLKIGYTTSNYKNIINDSELREIKSNNYNYGFELRSGFSGVFNYHIGTKWSTSKLKSTLTSSFTNNMSFLDLLFNANNKLNIQIQTERYFFGNIDKENSIYYFADLDARYTVKKNKLTLLLSAKNLFNTETFKTFAISDISTSTTEFRLLPRYLLLKIEYRF